MKVKIGSYSAEVPLEFVDLVKVDADSELTPATDDLSNHAAAIADPVGNFVAKAAKQTKGATTGAGDFDIRKAILAEADVRDREPSITTLRKDVSVPDWSWSTPVSTNSLEKRAHGTAKARFEGQLAEFFRGHDEELAEARALVDEALADERAAILSEV